MKRWNASCRGIIVVACQWLLAAAVAAEPARPAGEVTGQLVDAASKPLSGVTVCLCARRLDVYEAQFPQNRLSKQQLRDWKDGEGAWYFRETGADGRFSFPRPRDPFVFLASTEQGYVLARATGPAQPVTLRLTPSARLEGVVTAGDKRAGAASPSTGSTTTPAFRTTGRTSTSAPGPMNKVGSFSRAPSRGSTSSAAG